MKQSNLRILIIDDESSIRTFLRTSLKSNGFSVFEASTGGEGFEMSVSAHPDLLILDLGLPDADGLDILKKIRRRSKVPIIILSVRDNTSDKVRALELGADDYLSKPFEVPELLARIKAVIRRLIPMEQKTIFESEHLKVDFTKRIISVDKIEIDLTPTEYEVLKILILNAGQVITHRQILQEVWNKNEEMDGSMHLLHVTVRNLRKKIASSKSNSPLILTEPCIGYRFKHID